MNALSLTNKKVLVIGASGQIGTELLKQLKAESCKITALRRSKWDKVKKRSSINYLSSDIKDYDSDILKKLILENDYIFHLAGDVDVQSSPEEESKYFFSWISPLQRILSSIVGSNKVLVFASSCSVYGNSPKLPVVETTREDPLSSYDLAKVGCDYLIQYYRSSYGVLCSSLRFSNVFGPAETSKFSSRKVINKILENIHSNKEVTLVEDGNFLRNYIHVSDAAAMLIQTVKEIKNCHSILLGCSEENLLFKDVIYKLVNNYEEKFHKKIKVNFGMKKRYITDLRQFSAKPSDIFLNNFTYKHNLDTGLKDIVNRLEDI